ncbi:MAG: threonine synthase [Halodesulfurarchaeum sp.]
MGMEHVEAYRCIECGEEYDPEGIMYTCPNHDDPMEGILDIVYDYDAIDEDFSEELGGEIPDLWKYRPFLPVAAGVEPVTLGEGGTDLIEAPTLGAELGVELFVKDDSRNPTASFKDRATTVTVTKAKHHDHDVVTCASTGNAAASLAGYAARAGLEARIFVPESAPEGKLAQPLVYGADVIQVQGTYPEAGALSLDVTETYGWYNRNAAFNPFQVEGKRTAGLEIAEQTRGDVPDWVVVSVGDGCTIAGVWKGLKEFEKLGYIEETPKMLGVQAEGAPVIHEAFHGEERLEKKAETLADSIAVAAPANLRKAVTAMEESDGNSVAVSDREILEAELALGSTEGLFTEPAAAAIIAGTKKAVETDIIEEGESVVVVSSGYGLKDLENAKAAGKEPYSIPPDIDEVEAIFGE